VELVIGVAREGERREARRADRNAEFLHEFADERLFRPLARLQLAARKLPQARQRASGRALRQQNAAVGVDQRAGDDENELHDR
jgi:hypothetical protein